MYSYQPASGKWNKIKEGIPATEKQQEFLVKLGWGREDVTKESASILIDEILNS